MKKTLASAILSFSAFAPLLAASPFSVSSADYVEYADNYTKGTGGKYSVLLVNTVDAGAALTFSVPGADSLYNCRWFSFSQSAEVLEPVSSGVSARKNETTLEAFAANKGYAVQFEDEGGNKEQYCVWLTKFAPITSVKWKDEFYCDRLPLHVAPVMVYRQFQGFETAIDRNVDVSYRVFEMEQGILKEAVSELLKGDSVIYIPAVPTVDTPFEFSDADFGGKFVSDTFFTNAVNAFPVIFTTDKAPNESDSKNLQKEGDNVVLYFGSDAEFRSSGPMTLNIKANISPKVNDMEWVFASDSLFLKNRKVVPKNAKAIQGNNYNLYNYELLNRTGVHWVKLVARNLESECEFESVARFEIKGSALYIPNAFTPGGDNPEFICAFRSIESYECRIYNQSGRKVFESTDVTKGWDGTHNGHDMPTGVYFYVITATGTDGVSYNKKGTINLLRAVD